MLVEWMCLRDTEQQEQKSCNNDKKPWSPKIRKMYDVTTGTGLPYFTSGWPNRVLCGKSRGVLVVSMLQQGKLPPLLGTLREDKRRQAST